MPGRSAMLEVECSRAFDRHFSALALRRLDGDKPVSSVERSAGVRALKGDEELVAAQRRVGERQDDSAVAHFARLERVARDAGQLVAGRQRTARVRGSPCTTVRSTSATIRTSDSPSVRSVMTSRHRADLARGRHRRAVAHRPPHFGRRAGIERRLDDGPAVGGRSARDPSGDRRAHLPDRPARRSSLRRRRPPAPAATNCARPGRRRQRRAPLQVHRERARARKDAPRARGRRRRAAAAGRRRSRRCTVVPDSSFTRVQRQGAGRRRPGRKRRARSRRRRVRGARRSRARRRPAAATGARGSLCRAIDQAVVLGERQGDRSRRLRAGRSAAASCAAAARFTDTQKHRPSIE